MKKIQAFLVFGFVITLIFAIDFFIQKETEKSKRIAAEKNLVAVIEAKEKTEQGLNKKIETILAQIEEKEKAVNYTLAALSKEKKINDMLATNIKRANTRLNLIAQNKKAVELERIVVTSLNEVEGRVLAVDKANDLIVVNLGVKSNVKNGDKLSIYRGDEFIAKAELVKVENNVSAACILSGGRKDVDVKVDDSVKIL